MNDGFFTFLSLSLSGSLAALVLFLLKPLYRNRLSKAWQFYIYLVVVLRFLIPFGPETSIWEMIFPPTETEPRYETFQSIDLLRKEPAALLEAPVIQPPAANASANDPLGDIWETAGEFLWQAWLVPACFMLVRMVFSYSRLVKRVGDKPGDSSQVLNAYGDVCREMGIHRPPVLIQNGNAPSPMLLGLVNPVIVLPELNQGEDELRYMLRHELTHYKRGDIFYKWFAQIMVCLHWFNPLAHLVSREIDRNCELSCDEAVVGRMNENEKLRYGNMLLDMIKPDVKPAAMLAAPLGSEAELIKERLQSIIRYRKSSLLKRVSSLVLASVFLICAASTGTAAAVQSARLSADGKLSESKPPKRNDWRELPDKFSFESNPSFALVPDENKFETGPYWLTPSYYYSLTVSWEDGPDNLEIWLASKSGGSYEKEYTISNGRPLLISAPFEDAYTLYSPSGREGGDMKNVVFELAQTDEPAPVVSPEPFSSMPGFVYEQVTRRHYEQNPEMPYIHDISTNNTGKTIDSVYHGMVAFDKDGNPLKLEWDLFSDSGGPQYFFLYNRGSNMNDPDDPGFASGETMNLHGGWSLVPPPANDTEEIAYVLYCPYQINFKDGTVWENSGFDEWRETFEGKKTDVQTLNSYYPYVNEID